MSGLDTEVLIAGAGPTGLVLALWLSKLGIRLRIIDKTAEPGTTSRAVAVQARTLELYRQVGLDSAVVERSRRIAAVNLWVAGKQKTHAVFGEFGAGLSPYPYALTFPQDEHERLLIDRLAQLHVVVERQTELVSFEESSAGVLAHLKGPDGAMRECRAAYLAGCDGAHSAVREGLAMGFSGGTYEHLFYVADVTGGGTALNGEVHVALDRSDFLAVFPLQGQGRARLVGTIRPELEQRQETLAWNDVSKRVLEWMRIDVQRVNWFSTYRVHHRVASHFRKGRCFLAGDAGHVHSPVGGQGMNTGIGDAVNLAWKLAAVCRGRADASLLDTYETERIGFARRLVATTDQAFVAVTSSGTMARAIRLRVAPAVLPLLFQCRAVQRLLFRTVSQTAVNYRESDWNEGRAGRVHGGDRLPWVASSDSGESRDNFEPLSSLDWQLHVYGDASSELRAVCDERKLPLHALAWRPRMSRAGVQRNAAYLVRPDGYVALADPQGDSRVLASYLDARGIVLTPSSGA